MKFFASAIVGMAFSITAVNAQDRTVTIATEGAFAPWNFTAPGGKLDGFEVELARDLCDKMAVKCEIIAQNWDGIIPSLNAQKFDAIMAGMGITEQRQQVINFSIPYAEAPSTFMLEKNSPLVDLPDNNELVNLTDEAKAAAVVDALAAKLDGTVIGVQGSTTQANFLEKYLKGKVEIRHYKTTEMHDLDLASGRIDAVFAGVAQIGATLDKPNFSGSYVMAGPRFVRGVIGTGAAVGLRKDDTELKAAFDKAITAAIADGTVKKLSVKWFKTDITPAD